MTSRVKIAVAVPLAVIGVLALLVGAGLLAGCGASGSSSGSTAGSSDSQAVVNGAAKSADGADGAPYASGELAAGTGSSASDIAAAVPPASSASAHYLMRNGDMSLLVARGTLLSNVDRIKAMTAAMNGYVMSSSLGTQSGGVPEPMPLDTSVSSDGSAQGTGSVAAQESTDGSNPYASLVVRVPEALFDTAIKRFSRLGDVQSATTSSEDVTSQFVDLQARLRHYRAVERRLLGFLQQTTTVNQMLTVQDRIDKVQLTIEELSAQIKSLSETTTYGTLSVYVTERDRPATAVNSSNTFGGTLGNSIALLGRAIRVAGLVLTALAPFIVVFGAIGVLVWYVVRRVRRNRRRTAAPTTPAA
jgi:hypothetical protein